jgi:hypothetical protein
LPASARYIPNTPSPQSPWQAAQCCSARSRAHARAAGIEARTEFRVQDLFATDLARATVVTMYLLPRVNLQLRSRLLALAPGTRIVSHDWDLGNWTPDRTVVVDVPGKPVGRDKVSRLHLWTVPVALHGPWCSEGAPRLRLAVVQCFAAFSGTLEIDDAGAAEPLAVFDGRVDGTRLRTADAGGVDMTWGADGLRLRSAGTPVVLPDGRLFRPGPCSASRGAPPLQRGLRQGPPRLLRRGSARHPARADTARASNTSLPAGNRRVGAASADCKPRLPSPMGAHHAPSPAHPRVPGHRRRGRLRRRIG